MRVNSDL